jgi:hypothetical protein
MRTLLILFMLNRAEISILFVCFSDCTISACHVEFFLRWLVSKKPKVFFFLAWELIPNELNGGDIAVVTLQSVFFVLIGLMSNGRAEFCQLIMFVKAS